MSSSDSAQSRTVELCIAGARAEFERRPDEALGCYREAWQAAACERDRAVAAHYLGHLAKDAAEAHRWNLLALGIAMQDEASAELLAPLLLSAGGSAEAVGDDAAARGYFARAAELGAAHCEGFQPWSGAAARLRSGTPGQ